MPEEATYNVVKITGMLRRKQPRLLKLTDSEIHNIKLVKKQQVVTKAHCYTEVSTVVLVNTERFDIQYSTDHDYRYQSPVAPQIVAEIQSRVSIYDRAQRSERVRALSPTPTTSAPDTPHTHAAEEAREAEGVEDMGSDPMSSDGEGGDRSFSRRRTKLEKLTGTTEGDRLRAVIDEVVFSSASDEGHTVIQYVAKFKEDWSKVWVDVDRGQGVCISGMSFSVV
ncbi:hypothetical protein KIPB_009666 [Kipferlia bialata]|uniref:Uncharacterized protein n=1 Tax=Kipferlia bialata TaxID=797122 RepID=A0A9K3GMA9_9EUKA|nr:hypothetical protein KIPB_009666 [Kipferlia bialata]|eukprot:g9666.t1